jgi:hypothetical protein
MTGDLSPGVVFAVLSVLGAFLIGFVTVAGAVAYVLLWLFRQGRAMGAFEGRLATIETGHKALAQEARERLGHVEGAAAQRDGDIRELKALVSAVKDTLAQISGALEELRRYVTPPPTKGR